MKNGDWFGSDDSEYYKSGPYETKEEAIEKCPSDMALESKQQFWVGQIKLHAPEIDDYWIVEYLKEQACESCASESSEDWELKPKRGKNLGEYLTSALNEWLTWNDQHPEFGGIENAEECWTP